MVDSAVLFYGRSMVTVCTTTTVNTSRSVLEQCLLGDNLNVAAVSPSSRMANLKYFPGV